jgi:hypothetical protein
MGKARNLEAINLKNNVEFQQLKDKLNLEREMKL